MSFVLVGALLSSYVSAVFWGMGFSLKTEMDTGVLESNWMLPVPRLLFLVGQTVASLAITTLTGSGAAPAGLAPLRLSRSPATCSRPQRCWPRCWSHSMDSASPSPDWCCCCATPIPSWMSPTTLVSLLSGSQFPVEVLPRVLLPLALALPTTYGYDAVRGALLGTRTLLPIPAELGILVVSMVLLVTLGTIVFRLVERRCRIRGTIGSH